MGCTSNYPRTSEGVRSSVLESLPALAAHRAVPKMKTLCLTLVLSCMVSFVPCLPIAYAEEKADERSLIIREEPEYPETLQRLYIGGVVRLELTIAAKGNVERVTLLGGNPILGQSAMAAVRKWKYAPAHSRTVSQVKIPFDPHR
jgi:TonB family protein